MTLGDRLLDAAAADAIVKAAEVAGYVASVDAVDALADGMPRALRARRAQEDKPRRQLRADLALFQALDDTEDNRRALRAYLEHGQTGTHEAGFMAFQAVLSRLFADHVASFVPIDDDKELPERIVFRDKTLPIDFLAGGTRAAASVGKLTIKVHDQGAPVPGATSKGTGWLLTPTHVVTALHVLHARKHGEAGADLAPQAATATLSLDGVHELPMKGLVVGWKDLDVAVVELAAPVAAPLQPLVCGTQALVKPSGDVGFYVNVIQHPYGQEKRIGLRANAALDVSDRDVFYFTDTEEGSSGAPCFDDEWRVIAVHRAAVVKKGVEYLGRTVGFANVGTRIAPVLDRLERDHRAVFDAIRTS
jgi:hypothetical protein